ncbi:hypothetical protein FLM55_08935 [Francisella sp. Scap27]|uniref:hypothetical protein n=1 Tax=Francisella sp. Scap27 TaxID=2589986 RepID=UPI0015C0DC22|nr:hypothetical protein [Francisella sp. Scap27]QLE79848.1 hypothetical protein FLM55_08935 [Francisella sp. Scap27]
MLKLFCYFCMVLTLLFNFAYAEDFVQCHISEYTNGYDGKLSFKCDNEISLSENKVVFYIVGDAKLDNIRLYGVKVKYKEDEITKGLSKISVNLVTKGVFVDSDYIVNKNNTVNLKLIFSGDSNPKYKVLWGGVVKNSYKQRKPQKRNIQIYQGLDGKVYFYENGLKCAIENDCDDKVYIDENCQDNKNCNKFDNNYKNKKKYGLVY